MSVRVYQAREWPGDKRIYIVTDNSGDTKSSSLSYTVTDDAMNRTYRCSCADHPIVYELANWAGGSEFYCIHIDSVVAFKVALAGRRAELRRKADALASQKIAEKEKTQLRPASNQTILQQNRRNITVKKKEE